MVKNEDRDWYTVKEFFEAHPEQFRNFKRCRELFYARKKNGLEDAGACIKKPGRPVMVHRARFLRWQETPNAN